MRPRISVITLGVDDLERSLAFYRDGLGLPTQGIVGKEFSSTYKQVSSSLFGIAKISLMRRKIL